VGQESKTGDAPEFSVAETPSAAAPGAAGTGGPNAPDLPGPYPVGGYAKMLQRELRKRARVLLIGEVTGFSEGRVQAYFDLRDGDGAVNCSIWLSDLEKLGLPEGALRDGVAVVVGGGPDYYPGSAQSSPSFSFRATHIHLAGEGDLMARLAALRRKLEAEGLFEPQKRLRRPLLPKTIGVVTAEGGAARQDLLAGLERRGWRGTIVWAFAPVQDRRAAPAITRAIGDLAGVEEVEAIVVSRGGGSLADLWAFCDETLCRTVAMLRVPVVSAVGHQRDSTLIDDVAAVCCSTPTHAAEEAVPLDCAEARRSMRRSAATLCRAAQAAVAGRARHLAALARVPERALRRERAALNQKTREIRAAADRGLRERGAAQRRIALVVLRRAADRAAAGLQSERHSQRRRAESVGRSAASGLRRRREALERTRVALRAHDPERTLERGYALAEGPGGEPVTSAAEARASERLRLRFADGRLGVRVEDQSTAKGDDE
jgi:exodeoxyribonuclease VII large subunit